MQEKIIVFALMILSFALKSEVPRFIISVPFQVSTFNDAAKPSLELGAGIGVDTFLWSFKFLKIGLGASLATGFPLKTGNKAVRIRPLNFFLEERIGLGYALNGNFMSIMPMVGLKMHTGMSSYYRRVNTSSSVTNELLLAIGPHISVGYFFKNISLMVAYSATTGTKGIRQHFDLSLGVKLS